jgi:hypothetical protein
MDSPLSPRSNDQEENIISNKDNSYLNTNTNYYRKGFVNEIFSGLMRSDLYCRTCNSRNCTIEPFIDISLSLDIINSKF